MFNKYHQSINKLRLIALASTALSTTLLCQSCSPVEQEAYKLQAEATILPDFREVTLPANLAPVCFALADSCNLKKIQAIFESGNESLILKQNSRGIIPSVKEWNRLKQASDTITIRIQGKLNGKWVEFAPFHCYISPDSISRYLAYRLIEPGYEIWNQMGIYERDLETYDECELITNHKSNNSCINCHTFNTNKADNMLLHIRKELGGTYLLINGKVEKLDTKTPETISALVYPCWHPSGRFIAFSTNNTKQVAHSTDRNRVEVFDLASDIVLYDVEKHEIFSCDRLKSDAAFETFPAFSPDGKTLYFCSADTVNMPNAYKDVRYSICSIGFNVETASFTSDVDTLYNARIEGRSATFPRISPDGKFLMYSLSDYGNFSIWHNDADICMLSLQEGKNIETSIINSADAESYHSWSSNSRWVVISSRRDDGLYTRPYLVHISAEGTMTKPAPIPQKDAWHDLRLMKSYNIPEFVDSSFTPNAPLFKAAFNSRAIPLRYRK